MLKHSARLVLWKASAIGFYPSTIPSILAFPAPISQCLSNSNNILIQCVYSSYDNIYISYIYIFLMDHIFIIKLEYCLRRYYVLCIKAKKQQHWISIKQRGTVSRKDAVYLETSQIQLLFLLQCCSCAFYKH